MTQNSDTDGGFPLRTALCFRGGDGTSFLPSPHLLLNAVTAATLQSQKQTDPNCARTPAGKPRARLRSCFLCSTDFILKHFHGRVDVSRKGRSFCLWLDQEPSVLPRGNVQPLIRKSFCSPSDPFGNCWTDSVLRVLMGFLHLRGGVRRF